MYKIGISSRTPLVEKNQNILCYQTVSQPLINWLLSENITPFVIPVLCKKELIDNFATFLDGLILQGGSDISPKYYNEEPTHYEPCEFDSRDYFEIELINSFKKLNKPILGICRGMQLLNIVDGGSLYQDVSSISQYKHRNNTYDHEHPISWDKNSIFYNQDNLLNEPKNVISFHHQAVKDLGKNMQIEACSPFDNVIEAIRNFNYSFVYGVQWHPELHNPNHLDKHILLKEFLKHCK